LYFRSPRRITVAGRIAKLNSAAAR